MTTTQTDPAHEHVLFEWRTNPDGSITVTTSAAWDDYHAQRARPRRLLQRRMQRDTRHHEHALRAAMESLQSLYDDLYNTAYQQPV